MNNTCFENFKKIIGNNWEENFSIHNPDKSSTYKRIDILWKNGMLEHHYHASINVKTGDIYLDCRKRKIFAKNATFILLRPIHITIKTAWHASIIGPISREVFSAAKGRKSSKEALKNIINSMADIIRTPIYGIAMTVISIGSIILSPVSPNVLYHSREKIGQLERRLHRVENFFDSDFPVLSPCFSPIANIGTAHKRYDRELSVYNTNRGLSKHAKSQISFRMEKAAIFNDCYNLLPKDKSYISAAKLS